MAQNEKPSDIYFFEILVVAILFATFVYFIYLLGSAPIERYSSIYIKPDSYDNYLFGRKLDLVYGVENHENSDLTYTVEFFSDNQLLKKSEIFVEKGKFKEFQESLLFGQQIAFPLRLRVFLTKPNSKDEEKQNAFIWIFGDRKEEFK